MNKLDKAQEYFLEVRDLLLQFDGANHPEMFSLHTRLGQTYLQLGNLDEAEESLSTALQMSKDTHKFCSKNHALILASISQLKQRRGQPDEAHRLLQSVEEIRKAIYGVSHPDYVWTLVRLAELFQLNGNIEDAVRYSTRALAKAEEFFTPGSLATVLSSLGGVLAWAFETTGREQYSQEAMSVLEKALDLQRQWCKEDDAQLSDTLNNLGILRLMPGPWQKETAGPLLEEAFKIRKARQDFVGCHETLTGLSDLARFRGSVEESLNMLLEALALAEQHLGKYHSRTITLRG